MLSKIKPFLLGYASSRSAFEPLKIVVKPGYCSFKAPNSKWLLDIHVMYEPYILNFFISSRVRVIQILPDPHLVFYTFNPPQH